MQQREPHSTTDTRERDAHRETARATRRAPRRRRHRRRHTHTRDVPGSASRDGRGRGAGRGVRREHEGLGVREEEESSERGGQSLERATEIDSPAGSNQTWSDPTKPPTMRNERRSMPRQANE